MSSLSWPEIKRITTAFITWRVLLFILILASIKFFALRIPPLPVTVGEFNRQPLLWSHANFDGFHYLHISQSGYSYKEQSYFPFYPYLINKFSPVFGGNAAITGVFVSNASFFLALVFLAKLIRLDLSSDLALKTILLLLIFPTSFYFGSVYSESVFLLLAVLSFYLARTRHWCLAALTAGLACYTRLIGIALFPALLIEWWEYHKQTQAKQSLGNIFKLLPLLFIPLGTILFSLSLQKTTGDPLAFIHIQSEFGQPVSEKLVLLYQVFWRYLRMIVTVNHNDPLYWTIVLEAIVGLVFLATSIAAFKIQRLSYAVFNLTAYLAPTLSGSFSSLPRLVLICFPSFIIIAQFLSKYPKLSKILYIISAFSLFYYWMRFARGYWVG